jgi:hypothetical protein
MCHVVLSTASCRKLKTAVLSHLFQRTTDSTMRSCPNYKFNTAGSAVRCLPVCNIISLAQQCGVLLSAKSYSMLNTVVLSHL